MRLNGTDHRAPRGMARLYYFRRREKEARWTFHFRLQQERLKDEIGKYLSRFGEKKVAIWERISLAVIALTGLSGKIKSSLTSAV